MCRLAGFLELLKKSTDTFKVVEDIALIYGDLKLIPVESLKAYAPKYLEVWHMADLGGRFKAVFSNGRLAYVINRRTRWAPLDKVRDYYCLEECEWPAEARCWVRAVTRAIVIYDLDAVKKTLETTEDPYKALREKGMPWRITLEEIALFLTTLKKRFR